MGSSIVKDGELILASTMAGNTTCYRLGRSYLVLGIASTAFFLAINVGTVVAAYYNVDGSFIRPRLTALIFGAFWSCWTLLGLWIVAAYYRERLCVSPETIVQQGCIATTAMGVSEVMRIVWRRIPQGGSVILRSRTGKIKIEFGNFARDQRDELVQFIRGTFPSEIQEGWPHFSEARIPRKQNSRAIALVCMLMLLIFGGIFIYCWIAGLGIQWLAIGILNGLAILWYLYRLRARGTPTPNALPV